MARDYTLQALRAATANRLADTPADGELVVDTDLRAAGGPYLYVGDGATAGGLIVPSDNSVLMPWSGHGIAALNATGVNSLVSDGTTLTPAQATTALRPSFHVLGLPSTNHLRIVTSGIAYLPSTTLEAGKTYYLSDTTPDTLLESANEPVYSVRVCEVLRKVGFAAWVRFSDWRALSDAETAALDALFWKIVTTETNAHIATPANTAIVVDEMEWRTAAGVPEAVGSGAAFGTPRFNNSALHDWSHVFDGTVATVATSDGLAYISDSSLPLPAELGYQFTTSIYPVELMMRAAIAGAHPSFAPRDFTVQRSNDGIIYFIVKTVTGLTWTPGEEKVFDLTTP